MVLNRGKGDFLPRGKFCHSWEKITFCCNTTLILFLPNLVTLLIVLELSLCSFKILFPYRPIGLLRVLPCTVKLQLQICEIQTSHFVKCKFFFFFVKSVSALLVLKFQVDKRLTYEKIRKRF